MQRGCMLGEDYVCMHACRGLDRRFRHMISDLGSFCFLESRECFWVGVRVRIGSVVCFMR